MNQQQWLMFNQLCESSVARQVAFRPIARCDVFPLFQATQHPEFNQFLLWQAPESFEGVSPHIEKLRRDHELGHGTSMSIIEKDTGLWLGLFRVNAFEDGVDVGLYLHPFTWNRGTALIVGDVISSLIRKIDEKQSIYMRVHPENEKMKRLIGYFHFEKCEHTVQAVHPNHGIWTLWVYRHQSEHHPISSKLKSY